MHGLRIWTWVSLLLVLSMLVSVPSAQMQESVGSGGSTRVFLPMMFGPPPPPSPFGVDVREWYSDDIMQYVQQASPRWSRAGDLLWSQVEPVRGGGYRWDAMARLEWNILRLQSAGIEPMLIVQQSPLWAGQVRGRLCSPPAPQHVDDFLRFLQAAVVRYSNPPFNVKYWEIWNEPDYRPDETRDIQGVGCWGTNKPPFYGGDYYGNVLKSVYPAMKAANPNITIFGGALYYSWPDTTISDGFLRGMLAAGAGGSFDVLSFHAYGDWDVGDRLISKTKRIREILGEFGLATKPLIATEIAATCITNEICPPNFLQRQANYAARIYATVKALGLLGGFWYTFVEYPPGFEQSQLIDSVNGQLVPRPSFHAFRNSARALAWATYDGPPLVEPPPDQRNRVEVLRFRTPNSTLYVLWVWDTDFPVLFNMPVPPGVTAICTDKLSDPTPAIYYCSDTNNDGEIPRAVNELPQYLEIFDR